MTHVSLPTETNATPRWLHRWAVFTVCATFVLLLLGSLVTTKQVGMADPIWPTYPWHLLLVSWVEPRPGFLIEHTHRLVGYLVGCCIIVLAAGLWRTESRRWLRRLGMMALGGVILQGLLGGFRVKLDELFGQNLALIHGCFAQVVFALLVSLALFTAPAWSMPVEETGDGGRLRRWSLIGTGLVYLQIVFGAVLRHTYSSLGQRGHLLIAFAVVASVAWIAKEVWEHHGADRTLVWAATALTILVGAQLLMGIEVWMVKFFTPVSLTHQVLVRTAHVLLGSLILGTSVVVALLSRRYGTVIETEVSAVARPEGVA